MSKQKWSRKASKTTFIKKFSYKKLAEYSYPTLTTWRNKKNHLNSLTLKLDSCVLYKSFLVLLLFSNLFVNNLPIIFFYMFIYNITLVGLFWVLLSFYNNDLKTLYSFNMFSFDSSFLFFITIFLFSLAGVPPFMGFFSKIYILNLLVNQNFFLLYSIFIVLLIFGLYFYMQNLRFLHSTNHVSFNKPFFFNEKKSYVMYYYMLFLVFILINGVFFIEDLLNYFSWILL